MYYNQNYQTQQLIEAMVTMMMMAMGVRMVAPIMLPQKQKKLYYATLKHSDPLIAYLLKREGIDIHDYTAAYSREQARRFLTIRYPGYQILSISEVKTLPVQLEQLQAVEYVAINPLYAAEEWAALSPEKRMAIERDASLVGEKPFVHWLKIILSYRDWAKIRRYYDEVRETTEKYRDGKIDYPDYPTFPTIKKSLVKIAPSGYPEDIEECAKRYSHERLLRIARTAGVRVTGSNKDICFKLKQAGVFLQEDFEKA